MKHHQIHRELLFHLFGDDYIYIYIYLPSISPINSGWTSYKPNQRVSSLGHRLFAPKHCWVAQMILEPCGKQLALPINRVTSACRAQGLTNNHHYQWVGFKENQKETIVFPTIYGVPAYFFLNLRWLLLTTGVRHPWQDWFNTCLTKPKKQWGFQGWQAQESGWFKVSFQPEFTASQCAELWHHVMPELGYCRTRWRAAEGRRAFAISSNSHGPTWEGLSRFFTPQRCYQGWKSFTLALSEWTWGPGGGMIARISSALSIYLFNHLIYLIYLI